MADIFLSHVEEDAEVAIAIADALEAAGFSTWYYERDSIPGLPYLVRVCEEIDRAKAVLLLISPESLGSHQITVEVARAHESRKPFIPVLKGISHAEFQARQPEWRAALGMTASVRLPADGVSAILPGIIAGATALCRVSGPPTAPDNAQPEPPPAVVASLEPPVPQRQEPRPSAAAAKTWSPAYTNATDGYEMGLIPAGKAIFGSREDDPGAGDDEGPQFELEMPSYYLGLYCVTNAQYAAFLSAARPGSTEMERWIDFDPSCHVVPRGTDYGVDGRERYGEHPVVNVSWYGAEAYCEWAGLRLPAELEWEKGARGWDGLVYPWGNEWDGTKCRHNGNCGGESTCRVWEYPEGVSRYGLYNMSGNVWEWSADWMEWDAYMRYAAGDVTPSPTGTAKALRGGCWYPGIGPKHFRAAYRNLLHPSLRFNSNGFRCARDL